MQIEYLSGMLNSACRSLPLNFLVETRGED